MQTFFKFHCLFIRVVFDMSCNGSNPPSQTGIQENILQAMGIQTREVPERQQAYASGDHQKEM